MPCDSLGDAVYREQQRLLEMEERLRTAEEELRRRPGPETRLAFHAALSAFSEHLLEHFEEEEEGGFFQQVLETQPSSHPTVSVLRQEHDAMRAQVSLLRARISSHAGSSALPSVTDLLDALEHHERAERKLLQETFVTDTGAGD